MSATAGSLAGLTIVTATTYPTTQIAPQYKITVQSPPTVLSTSDHQPQTQLSSEVNVYSNLIEFDEDTSTPTPKRKSKSSKSRPKGSRKGKAGTRPKAAAKSNQKPTSGSTTEVRVENSVPTRDKHPKRPTSSELDKDGRITDQAKKRQMQDTRNSYVVDKKQEIIEKYKKPENVWKSPMPELDAFAINNDYFDWKELNISNQFTSQEKTDVVTTIKRHWCGTSVAGDYPKLLSAIKPSKHWWLFTTVLDYYLWWKDYCKGTNHNYPNWNSPYSKWPKYSLTQKHAFWNNLRTSY